MEPRGGGQHTKRNSVAANIDTQDRQRKAHSGEEASCSGRRSPEPVEDGVQKVPLIPVCFPKLALDGGRGADAEEEYQRLAGEDGGCLSPAGVLGSSRVACQVRLLKGCQ